MVKQFLLNPLQIYTDYATMQVIASEMHAIVDNLMHLLITEVYFIDVLLISVIVGLQRTLALESK